MKISQISVYQNVKSVSPKLNRTRMQTTVPSPQPGLNNEPENGIASPSFKGKFGSIVGGAAGAAAVVAGALLAAPAAICLLGSGTLFGAVLGDSAEDTINGESS